MMILLVAVVGLIVAAALALWPVPNDVPARKEGPVPKPGYAGGGRTAEAPSSLEGVLVEQLINGDITRRQYVRALELVAARDEQRHPWRVPGDDHPGACA